MANYDPVPPSSTSRLIYTSKKYNTHPPSSYIYPSPTASSIYDSGESDVTTPSTITATRLIPLPINLTAIPTPTPIQGAIIALGIICGLLLLGILFFILIVYISKIRQRETVDVTFVGANQRLERNERIRGFEREELDVMNRDLAENNEPRGNYQRPQRGLGYSTPLERMPSNINAPGGPPPGFQSGLRNENTGTPPQAYFQAGQARVQSQMQQIQGEQAQNGDRQTDSASPGNVRRSRRMSRAHSPGSRRSSRVSGSDRISRRSRHGGIAP